MTPETKRTLSIAIGVAAGILISSIIIFSIKIFMLGMAAKALDEHIKEEARKAKSTRIERSINQIKDSRRKALYEEMRRKEGSDMCRFWRQQKGKNEKAESKIKQHCYTGPDPRSI